MLVRQFATFGFTGLVAALAHYGALIALVEGARWAPLPATLVGYIAGGIVSYAANRRFTFRTGRRHRESVWRFIVVAGIGFLLTGVAMAALVNGLKFPYLPSQIATTGLVLVWSFLAHKLWTFGGVVPP